MCSLQDGAALKAGRALEGDAQHSPPRKRKRPVSSRTADGYSKFAWLNAKIFALTIDVVFKDDSLN